MIHDLLNTLTAWQDREDIHWVLLEGADRAFCAGGDIAETYHDAQDNPLGAMPFFSEEFKLDLLLHDYPKPLVVHYKGASMGGGIGLGCNADFIIADDTTRWAMPETRLGIIPDVGVGYFFSKLPRPEALYLSLTGAVLSGADLIPYGFATDYISSEDWEKARTELLKIPFKGTSYEDIVAELKKSIAKYHAPLPESTDYSKMLPLVRQRFDASTLPDLMDHLKKADDAFSVDCLKKLKSFCPLSLAITFGKYEAGQAISRADTFKKDLHILEFCWLSGNAAEGIRCAMIDKEDVPTFTPASIYDVDYEFIEHLLTSDE